MSVQFWLPYHQKLYKERQKFAPLIVQVLYPNAPSLKTNDAVRSPPHLVPERQLRARRTRRLKHHRGFRHHFQQQQHLRFQRRRSGRCLACIPSSQHRAHQRRLMG